LATLTVFLEMYGTQFYSHPFNAEILTRCTAFPAAWELNISYEAELQRDLNEDGENADDQSGDEEPEQKAADLSSAIPQSIAYQDFLHFLRHGCSGSPLEGYPAVIVVLSTISPSVSEPSTEFIRCLNHFTSAR